MVRRLAILAVLVLGGCAALPLPGLHRGEPPRLLRVLWIGAGLDRAVTDGPAVHAWCVDRWRLQGDTLDLQTASPAPEREAVNCTGRPVLLVRPTCTLTSTEALLYPTVTPVVAIRCPYGAAGYVTGFSKAMRGRV